MKKLLIVTLVLLMTLGLLGCQPQSSQDQTPSSPTTSLDTQSQAGGDLNNLDLEAMALAYITDFTSKNYQAMLDAYPLSPEMAKALTLAQLQALSGQIEGKYGPFVAILGQNKSTKDAYTIWSVGSQYEKETLAWNVVFDQEGQIAGLNIGVWTQPQASDPASNVKEITFGQAPFVIQGELRLPQADGLAPAIILVHGSGPNDRYETIGPNQVFEDLAQGLNEAGIAVLLYDKRTFLHAASIDPATFTMTQETVDDAVLAYQWLKNQEGIDPSSIYVLGHSQGGYMMPRIASQIDAAGYVFMAANHSPLEDLLVTQITYLANLDGSLTKDEEAQIDAMAILQKTVKSQEGILAATPDQLIGLSPAYWLDLVDYSPSQEAIKIEAPMLFLQGQRDYQVPTTELQAYQAVLGDQATYQVFDDLNHLMMPGEGTPGPAEYNLPNTVSQDVIQAIANFIKK